jgi:hypothetical protein
LAKIREIRVKAPFDFSSFRAENFYSLSTDSKLILEPARGKLDGTLLFSVFVGKPIETGCSQRKIHITALVIKNRSPGFAGHSFVNPFKASWNCRWHFMLRCAWQGCYGSAQTKNSPLPFLLANAHFASLRPLGIHEAEHQAFGFSGG